MAKGVVITADSTCDLPAELLLQYDIKTISMNVQLGDVCLPDNAEFTPEDLYTRFRLDGTLPKTSAPGLQAFSDFFAQYTRDGYEVVHLALSSELTSCYSTACIAASELGGVYVVDSRMLCVGLGLLAVIAAEYRDKGMSAEEIADTMRSLADKVDTSFVISTLEYLWKGGRCSAIAALGANVLKLKPGLEMRDGKLVMYKKYRGNMETVYRQYIKDRVAGKSIRPEHVFFGDSGEVDETLMSDLEAYVRELLPGCTIHRIKAGCTIASHSGPATVAIMFLNE